MTGVLFFVLVAVLAIGTQNNIKYVQAQERYLNEFVKTGKAQKEWFPSYNSGLMLIGGLGGVVALVALLLMKVPVVLAGVAVSVVAALPELKKANELAHLKQKNGIKPAMKDGPFWVWGRMTLIGIGKWVHAVMVCTLIGIPLYGMMSNSIKNIDDYLEEVRIREKLAALEHKEVESVIRKTEAEFRQKH